MKKIKNSGLIVFCVIVAVAVLMAAYAVIAEDNAGGGMSGSHRGGKGYIAKLYVEGVITEATHTYNQEWLLDTIQDLEDDGKNRAILLYLDTPGGGVYEADEVYLALVRYKRHTGRPVYAYMGPMAASGGYYIACAADKILANRNTLTGSIGVIFGSSFDATGLLEKLGIKSETFHSGENKNMLGYNEPLTDEQRSIMQSISDEAYEQFTGIVAESRKLGMEEVKKLADGRIYTAKQAHANGLIDGVCSCEQALDALKDDYGFDCEAEDFRYEEKPTLRTLLLDGAFKEIERRLGSASTMRLQALYSGN